MAVFNDHDYCASADHSTNFAPFQADFEHLFNLEASQGLRSSNREVVGLLSQRGAPSLPRPSLVKPTKVISAPKASPASKIHSQAHQADNISSYENGLRTLNSEIWTLEEQISDTPMSLENTSNNTFSEQVASYATLDPGEQMILPDLPDDLVNRQITKKVPAPSVGKSLLLKPAPSNKKKLMIKGNTISIPENAVAEIPFDASQMDPTLDLFPDLFNILGQDQAIELDVPVVIPPPASDNNSPKNVNDEWNLENDLAPIAESKPVLNTNAMLSVNPMEAEGVSVTPPQADEDLDKPVTAADFDLLEFAMESSGLASGENDANSYDPTNIIDLMLNDDITENDQAFLDLVKTDDDSNINNAAAGGSTLNLGDIQPSTSKRPWMPAAAVVKPEPFDEEDPDFVPTPAKRPRGRPRLPRPEPEPPRYNFVNDFTNCSQNSLTTNSNNCDFRRPRGRPPTARPFADVSAYEDTSGLSSEEAKDVKYRRMRDLNNAASKRCRLNRKMKFDKMEIEEQQLLAKNTQLKAQVEGLENQVQRLKELVLGMVSKVKNEQTEQNTATDEAIENFDIDKLVNDTIEDMQE